MPSAYIPSRIFLTHTHILQFTTLLLLSLSLLAHPPASVAAVAVGLGPSSRCTKQAVGTPRGNGGSSTPLILVVYGQILSALLAVLGVHLPTVCLLGSKMKVFMPPVTTSKPVSVCHLPVPVVEGATGWKDKK